jgi:hypothetical protein
MGTENQVNEGRRSPVNWQSFYLWNHIWDNSKICAFHPIKKGGEISYILTPGKQAAGRNVDKTRTNSGHYFRLNGCQTAQGEL